MMKLRSKIAWVAFAIILSGEASNADAVCLYNGDHFTKSKAPEFGGRLYAKTTMEQEFQDSALVITGKILSSRYVDIPNPDEDSAELNQVRVTRVFKGTVSSRFNYYTLHDSGGFYLDVGKEYLLFLNPTRPSKWEKKIPGIVGSMVVNYSCGQSRPWPEITAKLRARLKTLSTAVKNPK